MAPVEFHKLLDSQVTDNEVKAEVLNLLSRKMAGEELNEEPKIQILNDFLEQKIMYYNKYVKRIKQNAQPDTKLLNNLFLESLNEAWA
jgi:hypothetical protein